MKKSIKITLFSLAILLLAAVSLPFIFKGKIIKLITEEANKNVNAKVKFSDDIGLSIFESFPDFTLSMKAIEVVGINEFEGDTLLSLKNLAVSLDFMSVVNGEKIRIRNVFLNEPRIHAIILKNGKNMFLEIIDIL